MSLACKTNLSWGFALSPEEAYVRTQAVLEHFGVPREPDSQSFFEDLQGLRTLSEVKAAIGILDLKGNFAQRSAIVESPSGDWILQVFKDAGSKRELDYAVHLRAESTFEEKNPVARAPVPSLKPQPLRGLRVALDPGHMGGDIWDERTGKFVRDAQGHKLSEGLMALQIALLLEDRFRALGAEVFVTHRGLKPVTPLEYESFDLIPYALGELRQSVLRPWFVSKLSAGPVGPLLFDAFRTSPDFKKLFSESIRWRYFFQKADLEARAQAIEAFRPDLTLILHLDTSDPPGDPTGINPQARNSTKAYVPGGFFGEEFASRADRKYFGRHLLDAKVWNASVELSRAIVGQIQSSLGVPLETHTSGNSVLVEPGVLARNLALQRQLISAPSSYVECLFYNHPAEFAALSQVDAFIEIEGKNYPYSDRLRRLAESIGDGVLRFLAR